MSVKPRIETTDDGSSTLRHPVSGDTYHSTRGAVGEAMHVYIEAGLGACKDSELRVFEVGFGSGLNAWLTLQDAERRNINVEYHAVERFPVDLSVAQKLEYAEDGRFMLLHEAEWGQLVQITPNFAVRKTEADLVDMKFDTTFHAVYFDAFAPETQPELWTVDVFRKIYNALEAGGVLVTYSAKGVVKKALREAGFEVERLKGALGKRHMIRAVKRKPELYGE